MFVIAHRTMKTFLDAAAAEFHNNVPAEDSWVYQEVVLEFPMGEIAESPLKTMSLIGAYDYDITDLTGREQFNAQGLEGKIAVKMPLFNALMNLKNFLPQYRGRIIMKSAPHI